MWTKKNQSHKQKSTTNLIHLTNRDIVIYIRADYRSQGYHYTCNHQWKWSLIGDKCKRQSGLSFRNLWWQLTTASRQVRFVQITVQTWYNKTHNRELGTILFGFCIWSISTTKMQTAKQHDRYTSTDDLFCRSFVHFRIPYRGQTEQISSHPFDQTVDLVRLVRNIHVYAGHHWTRVFR